MSEKKATKGSAQLVVETLRNTLEQHIDNLEQRISQSTSLVFYISFNMKNRII